MVKIHLHVTNTMNIITYIFLFFSQVDNFLHNFNIIIYFILNALNLRVYHINSKERRNLLMKCIGKYKYYCNKYDENGDPFGIIIHKRFFPLFVVFHKNNFRLDTISIICHKTFFEEFTKDVKIKETIVLDDQFVPYNQGNNNNIGYITKSGEYGYLQYNTREVDLQEMSCHSKLNFYTRQRDLFEEIMTFYKSNHHCKIFLSGTPGCGKTYFGYLMSQKLNCFLCDVYKGNEPSSNFNEIYTQIKVSSERPIIVILDEVDILISKINSSDEGGHKKYSKEIHNKTTWNAFMDKIEYGMFPHVIILMTSNKKRREIDKSDSSYLRDGRINIVREWY